MKSRTVKRFIIITMMLSAISLSACGKTEDGGAENQTGIDHTTENVLGEEQAETVDSTVENTSEERENVVDDSASMERYENFLQGKEKVNISRLDFSGYDYDEREFQLNVNESYTMEDFFTLFFEDRMSDASGDYSVDELSYAYVDCGQDGTRELALQFVSNEYNDEYNNIMIIKDIDGKLEMCIWVADGYRSYNYLNQNGVLARGGSGGAGSWSDNYYGLDANGSGYLIYESEICSAYYLFFGGVDYGEIASNLGVDDISVIRYSFDGYTATDYDEETYAQYMKNCYYTYFRYTEEGDREENTEFYEPQNDYAKFMSLVTDNWHKPDEMNDILSEKLSEYGLTEEMLQYNEPSWNKWEGHDALFEATHYEAPTIVVENPSWNYYAKEFPYEQREDFVTMEEISHEANDIIDEEEWFEEIGVEMPADGVIEDPNGQYTYYLTSQYGEYYHQYDTVRIHDNWSGRDVATLDFSNHITPDEIAVGDASFVRECVRNIQIIDQVAYVSIAHRTYAASAPQNAYVMALDMNDNFSLIWKSEPLICNAVNFAIVDGSLICGYGFTDEPDYIYELNRYTGEKMNTVKVKTGPDYFYVIDGKLYVRTYNTNYVYQLGWG